MGWKYEAGCLSEVYILAGLLKHQPCAQWPGTSRALTRAWVGTCNLCPPRNMKPEQGICFYKPYGALLQNWLEPVFELSLSGNLKLFACCWLGSCSHLNPPHVCLSHAAGYGL